MAELLEFWHDQVPRGGVQPEPGDENDVHWGTLEAGWEWRSRFRETAGNHREHGWDFTDLHLDLVVDASGAWRVKDADDLSAATLDGRMTGREAETVKENCAALVDQLAQGRSLVDPRWIEWRPDSAWRTPSLHFDRGTRLATAPTPAMEDLTLDAWI